MATSSAPPVPGQGDLFICPPSTRLALGLSQYCLLAAIVFVLISIQMVMWRIWVGATGGLDGGHTLNNTAAVKGFLYVASIFVGLPATISFVVASVASLVAIKINPPRAKRVCMSWTDRQWTAPDPNVWRRNAGSGIVRSFLAAFSVCAAYMVLYVIDSVVLPWPL